MILHFVFAILAIFLSDAAWAAGGVNFTSGNGDLRMEACRKIRSGDKTCLESNSSPLGAAVEGLMMACQAQYQSADCKNLEIHSESKGKLLDCSPDGVCQMVGDGWAKCAYDKIEYTREAVTALVDTAAGLPKQIARVPTAARNFASSLATKMSTSLAASASCDENKNGEKQKIIQTFEASLSPELRDRYVVSAQMRDSLVELPCGRIQEQLEKRMIAHEREYAEGIRNGQIKIEPAMIDKSTTVMSLMRDLAQDIKLKAQCYNPVAQGEIMCEAAIFFGGFLAGGVAGVAAKEALASLVARGLISASKAERLAALAGAERLAEGSKMIPQLSKYLNRFSTTDRAAIERKIAELERRGIAKEKVESVLKTSGEECR